MKPISTSLPRWQRLALAALFALLGACQPATDKPAAPKPAAVVTAAAGAHSAVATQPIVSDTDKRAFRYLELPNHLRVLLISSPGTDKAAAALDVNVGSREDPAQRPGLAHFLEHMLFLGTDKYPQADAYQNFISSHGGDHNAFTAFENTNFFFDIDSAYLEPALDRFARFFVAPLFTAEYVEREKHAVNSEYLANIRNDQRRELDVMREVINPANPLSKFSVGDLDTLADRPGDPVRDDLLKFYHKNYSANLMTLVVIGRESLDQLQAMVTSRFSAVPNHERHIAPVTAPLLAPGTAPEYVEIKPVQQERTLSLSWPLPDQRDDFRGKSLEYIGNILGHEGAGSLLSVLKQRGWALGLSAGGGFDYDGGTQFNIDIQLTATGEKHSDEIIALVYQTIALIRDGGIQDRLYKEQHLVAEQRFRFREPPEPIREASQLAGNLQDYPPAEVIRGDYLMAHFEPERIAALLARLTPQNMLVMLTAPDARTDKTSAYYSTPYSVQTASEQRVQTWLQPLADADIHLPAPNIFIAEHLPLKPLNAHAGDKPALLPTRDGLKLWFLQDAVFRVPKAMVAIEVQSPIAEDSARHAATTDLLVRMLRENLNEFSYPASLAGLDYSIASTGRGVALHISGFDAKQDVLLERMLDALTHATIDPAVFARVHTEYQRELRESIKRPPYELLRDEVGNVLVRHAWTNAELLKGSEQVSAADVQRFAPRLLARVHVDMLVYGNVVTADATRLGALVSTQLLAHAQPIADPLPVSIMRLDAHDYRRTIAAPHADSALLWYRQAGDNSKATRVALGLSAQMIGADFYTRLRTEQQFGYIVAAFPAPLRDVPGLVFLTQSTKAGPAQLADAYRAFLQRWSQRSEAELKPLFELHRATLIQRLAEKPKNIGEAGGRLWQDMDAGYTHFDSREQLIAALQALTFEQWLPRFRRDVLDPDGHALWLAVDGKFKHAGLRRGTRIGDLAHFKAEHPYYRF